MSAKFSIILLSFSDLSLDRISLFSLVDLKGDFEVVVVDGIGNGAVNVLKEEFTSLDLKIIDARKKTKPQMIHLATQIAKGKYLHFLTPGEKYISNLSLLKIEELDSENFSIICFQSYLDDAVKKFELDSLIEEDLTCSCMILRSFLLEMKGLNLNVLQSPILDFVCRLVSNYPQKVLQLPYVIVDSVKIEKPNAIERFLMICRYLGIGKALYWLLLKKTANGLLAVFSRKV